MNWFTQLFTDNSVAQSVVIYSLTIAAGIALGKNKKYLVFHSALPGYFLLA